MPPTADPTQRTADALCWLALLIVLIGALLRAALVYEPLPYWDVDPARVGAAKTGLGPAELLVIDAATVLAAALALLGERLRRRPISLAAAALLFIGAAGALAHAMRADLSLEHARIGSAWTAALATGLAMMHLGRDARLARLAAAVIVGFIAVLAVKGALQILLEHPATLADYRAQRDAFLQARGWSPDSPMARNFERRLAQPEATGWFGLANVYASFAAASAVALLALAVAAWRAARRPAQLLPDGWAGLTTLGLFAAGAAVWMAGSKAGLAITAFGAALLLVPHALSRLVRAAEDQRAASGPPHTSEPAPWLRRLAPPPRTAATLIALAAVILPLAAIALRGLLGERLGELSLLFRSFYLRGAIAIIADHPLLGVGPAGFKDAYMLAKPAIAPEDVTSAHSVLFDLGATLGLAGLAWIALLAWWTWRAAAALTRPAEPPEPAAPAAAPGRFPPARVDAWTAILIAAAVIIASANVELPQTTTEAALARILALLGWISLSLALLALMRVWNRWPHALAAAALALIAHAQIEVTPVWPTSAPLFMLWLGLAAAPGAPATASTAERTRRLDWAAPVALAGIAAVVGLALVLPALGWQRHLRDAAEDLAPLADLRRRAEALSTPGSLPAEPGDTLARLHADVLDLLEPPQEPVRPTTLDHDLLRLFIQRAARAEPTLCERALTRFPAHRPTLQAASRLLLDLGAAAAVLEDDRAQAWLERAEQLAQRATASPTGQASAWAWLATVREARARIESDPAHRARAIDAWEHAAALDPHGLNAPRRLAEAHLQLGQEAEARRWAQRLLENDANLRLDPLLRLTDAERARYERLAER